MSNRLSVCPIHRRLFWTAVNANNQLTQWGGSPIGYDANGNMTSDSTKTYSWDARNHLGAALLERSKNRVYPLS